jgi:thioredoxin-related protein
MNLRKNLKLLLTLLIFSLLPVIALSAYEEIEEETDELEIPHPRTEIIEATNLQKDAESGLPVLLLVSQEHCPFCVLIKQDILGPMILAGDYRGELLIRELFIDLHTSVVDFNGKTRDSAEFAHSHGVNLTPTLLFLGPDGQELTKRIIGINTPEMFFFYVDASIQEAIKTLEKLNKSPK